MSEPFSIVCVSRQEWNVDLPTNRQQIMQRAARRGHRVLFVESGDHLGRHLWRLVARPGRRSLLRRLFLREQVAEGVEVRKAFNLAPWSQRFGTANRINAALTKVLVGPLADRLPSPRVLWLYDPCAHELAGAFGEAFAVYDCVDDYAEQVGTDARRKRFVATADGKAAERAAVVFATTNGLYERHLARNPETHLVRNGADFGHFSAVEAGAAANAVRSLPAPVIGFAGNLTAEKVDFALIESVAAARPDWTFALVGPVAHDARESVARLAERPNVHWLGAQPYADLPGFVAGFAVGVIPYRESAYTRNCSPLKVFEYLAAGKAVVASGVPEIAGMEPDVVVTEGDAAFLAAVEAALADDDGAARARRQALAARNTWDGRTERLLELVETRLAG
ncbi:MAG: glycosyltransferase [Gaiellaceae bacterium]